jgi:hypothetical protein
MGSGPWLEAVTAAKVACGHVRSHRAAVAGAPNAGSMAGRRHRRAVAGWHCRSSRPGQYSAGRQGAWGRTTGCRRRCCRLMLCAPRRAVGLAANVKELGQAPQYPAQVLALRARIVLACADGGPNLAVARGWPSTGARWAGGTPVLARPAALAGRRAAAPRGALHHRCRGEGGDGADPEEVPEGAAHWSKRELAAQVDISPSSVHHIWRALGLQPWRTEAWHAVRTDEIPGSLD